MVEKKEGERIWRDSGGVPRRRREARLEVKVHVVKGRERKWEDALVRGR